MAITQTAQRDDGAVKNPGHRILYHLDGVGWRGRRGPDWCALGARGNGDIGHSGFTRGSPTGQGVLAALAWPTLLSDRRSAGHRDHRREPGGVDTCTEFCDQSV
jgi:hypothetical protein